MNQNESASGAEEARSIRVPFTEKDRSLIEWHLKQMNWWRTSRIAAVVQGLYFGQIVGILVGAPVNLLFAGCATLFDFNGDWVRQYRVIPFTLGYVIPTVAVSCLLIRSNLRDQHLCAPFAALVRQDLLLGEMEILEFRASRAVRIDNEYRIRTYFVDDEAGTRYVLVGGGRGDQPDIGSRIRISRLPTALLVMNWTASGEPVPVLMRCFCYHDEHEFPDSNRPAEISWDAFVAEWLPYKDLPIDYDEEESPDEDEASERR